MGDAGLTVVEGYRSKRSTLDTTIDRRKRSQISG